MRPLCICQISRKLPKILRAYTIFAHHISRLGVLNCLYSTYKTHGTEAKIANSLQMPSMEDFGVLGVWGFRGDSHRFLLYIWDEYGIEIQSPWQP